MDVSKTISHKKRCNDQDSYDTTSIRLEINVKGFRKNIRRLNVPCQLYIEGKYDQIYIMGNHPKPLVRLNEVLMKLNGSREDKGSGEKIPVWTIQAQSMETISDPYIKDYCLSLMSKFNHIYSHTDRIFKKTRLERTPYQITEETLKPVPSQKNPEMDIPILNYLGSNKTYTLLYTSTKTPSKKEIEKEIEKDILHSSVWTVPIISNLKWSESSPCIKINKIEIIKTSSSPLNDSIILTGGNISDETGYQVIHIHGIKSIYYYMETLNPYIQFMGNGFIELESEHVIECVKWQCRSRQRSCFINIQGYTVPSIYYGDSVDSKSDDIIEKVDNLTISHEMMPSQTDTVIQVINPFSDIPPIPSSDISIKPVDIPRDSSENSQCTIL